MDKVLRGQVTLRARGGCEWPQCRAAGEEIAHLHSRGMGGNRKLRDVLDNLMWLCGRHARHSDGERGPGGSTAYRDSHLELFGDRFLDMPFNVIAFERAEALRELIQ